MFSSTPNRTHTYVPTGKFTTSAREVWLVLPILFKKFFCTDVKKNLLTLWENKSHRIPCYASLHVCDTFFFNLNAHFEVFAYELLIKHTSITTILLEHTLISINLCTRGKTYYIRHFLFYAALHICDPFLSGTYKDFQYF